MQIRLSHPPRLRLASPNEAKRAGVPIIVVEPSLDIEHVKGLAADCLHPLIVTFSGTVGYTEFPASYGMIDRQLPGGGPLL